MSSKHHILFDLDGTLTDSFKGIVHSVQYALSRYGIVENDLHKLTPFIGPPLTYSFREFYHFSDAQADEAVSYYREYFSNKGWCENTAYPGIPEMLKTLCEAGKHLYVATSKPTEFAVRILEHFGLSVFFDPSRRSFDGEQVCVSGIPKRFAPHVLEDAKSLKIGIARQFQALYLCKKLKTDIVRYKCKC